MKIKLKPLTTLLLLVIVMAPSMRADEGMWIPLLIEKYNIKLMQEKGFKLTAKDIRLVGAPPSAIGKFGGETDNWVWPRHTGDFSLFRIYANKENKPAEFAKENVPYKPLYHFPISLKGVNEGDFTMVFGYPGTTAEYVPSYHIDMVKNFLKC